MSWLGSSVAVLLLSHLHCIAAIDRLQLFPFGATQGDARLDVGDDVSSSEVQLRTPIVFYDDIFSSLYVSADDSKPARGGGAEGGTFPQFAAP